VGALLAIPGRDVAFSVWLAELLGNWSVPAFVRGYHFERHFRASILGQLVLRARSLLEAADSFQVSFTDVQEFEHVFTLGDFVEDSAFIECLSRGFIRWPAGPLWPIRDAYGGLRVRKESDEEFRLVFFQVTYGETHSLRLSQHPAGALLQWAIENAH
jgi:hypothetical protein